MTHRPLYRIARTPVAWFAVVLAAVLSPVARAQVQGPANPPTSRPAEAVKGEVVSELDPHIFYILQDSKNNYWFGSRGAGVFRHDGKTLTRFSTGDGLAGNRIWGLQEDKAGNVYIFTSAEAVLPTDGKPGSDRGLTRFDGKTFSQVTIPLQDAPDTAWRYQPDDLWFAGDQDTGCVYRYDGRTVHRLRFPRTEAGDRHYANTPRDKFPNARYSPYDVYSIFKDSRGHVWFGTCLLGVCRYDGKTHDWISKEQLEIDPGDAVFGVRSVIEDKDGKFWFTRAKYRFDVPRDRAPGQEKGVTAFKKEKGIHFPDGDNGYFLSAVKDRKGDLWLATLGDGVLRYDGKNMTHYPVTVGGSAIWLSTLHLDRQDNLWLGTQEHGVYRFNGKAFEKFRS